MLISIKKVFLKTNNYNAELYKEMQYNNKKHYVCLLIALFLPASLYGQVLVSPSDRIIQQEQQRQEEERRRIEAEQRDRTRIRLPEPKVSDVIEDETCFDIHTIKLQRVLRCARFVGSGRSL